MYVIIDSSISITCYSDHFIIFRSSMCLYNSSICFSILSAISLTSSSHGINDVSTFIPIFNRPSYVLIVTPVPVIQFS